MDLGINGKTALVCASSKGLGLGCAEALAAAGVNLIMNARGAEALETAAELIRHEYGVSVTTVAADIATEEGQQAVLAAAGEVDAVVEVRNRAKVVVVANVADAVVARGQLAHALLGVVGRAVVANDQLEVGKHLGQHRADSLFGEVAAVVDRHADRHGGRRNG